MMMVVVVISLITVSLLMRQYEYMYDVFEMDPSRV